MILHKRSLRNLSSSLEPGRLPMWVTHGSAVGFATVSRRAGAYTMANASVQLHRS